MSYDLFCFLFTDVPEQLPGKPYASDTSLRNVVLSWGTPSSDGGSPIVGYRVEMCEAEDEVWKTLTEQCHVSPFVYLSIPPSVFLCNLTERGRDRERENNAPIICLSVTMVSLFGMTDDCGHYNHSKRIVTCFIDVMSKRFMNHLLIVTEL